MKSLNGIVQTPVGKSTKLKKEKQVLTAENHQLRSDNAAAIFKLEKKMSVKEKYEESRSRFETIFYKSKMGNKIIAPDLRIIQINEVLLGMLGYTAKEVVGTKVISYAHPDFVHHWDELQENLWTKQIPSFQIETCLVRKDGSVFWCQVTSIVFRDNGASLGYTIVEDISERKALELELKKLYDYQETVMHMVAHDLKSPVNNIKSLSDFLKKNLEKLPAAEEEKNQSRKLLEMISDTCDRSYAIIRDLLLIGELRSKETFEKADLKIFVESQLTLLGVDAQKKGIEIVFHYPEGPTYAHIDGNKFARVLENLISNAVKFTNAGGQVTVSLKNENKKVVLQVSDNGIGIPEKLQSSVFNRFTKATRKGTEGETTTGLGLYIVKQIVDIHRGRIWFESRENVGTSFFIELV